jgi:hypothetical protein
MADRLLPVEVRLKPTLVPVTVVLAVLLPRIAIDPVSVAADVTPGSNPSFVRYLSAGEEQQCKDDALARPAVLQPATMNRAGIRTEQNMRFRLSFSAMPEYCLPGYTRATHIDQYMTKHGRWIKIGPTRAFTFGQQAQVSDYIFGPSHPKPEYVYDECINGHWQRDKLVVATALKAGENHHRAVAAERKYTFPVGIHGHCRAAVRSRKYWQTHSY